MQHFKCLLIDLTKCVNAVDKQRKFKSVMFKKEKATRSVGQFLTGTYQKMIC